MSNAELVYGAVVLFVGVPAARWNFTAAALVLVYAFMTISYYAFHAVYSTGFCVLADITVMAVIYAKQPARDLFPYEGWRDQLAALWLEKSFWDRIVLALFPVGWIFYAFAASPWWPLYWISLAQLLAAGLESLETYRNTRTAKRASAPDPPGFLFSPGRGPRPWAT